MNTQKTVIFTPDYSTDNPYQNLLANSIEQNGYKVNYANYPKGLFLLNKLVNSNNNPDVIHLHWITEIIRRLAWSRNGLIFRIKCFLLMLDCLICRARGTKIIWTIHNKTAHEGHDQNREIYIRRLLTKYVSQVIIHSEQAKELLIDFYQSDALKNAQVIPHGNYDNCYASANKTEAFKQKFQLTPQTNVFLFFGAVRPYKGVENLIENFKQHQAEDAKLLIFGKPSSDEYKQVLLDLIDNHKNIITEFSFIKDEDVADILNIADYIVLPFAKTLTSGSTILAMTHGKALILPDSASIFGCVPDEGVIYFDDNSGLLPALQSATKAESQSRGLVNLEAAKQLCWDKIGKQATRIYSK